MNYTYTTEEIRDCYHGCTHDCADSHDRADFDAWLTEHDRQAKEQAWNQGAEAVALLIPEYEWHDRGLRLPTNPYRKQP